MIICNQATALILVSIETGNRARHFGVYDNFMTRGGAPQRKNIRIFL